MKKKIVLASLILVLLLSACSSRTGAADPAEVTSGDDGASEINSDVKEENNTNPASSDDLSDALNLLLGTTDSPSVFDSYHMEMTLDTPKANEDDTAVVNEAITISADVAEKNVHIFQVDPGETEAKEGYIIGDQDKEYKLIDGNWEETMGTIALAWAMWPLQVVMPYAYTTALYANKTGSEDLNGRSADVYELDTTKADPSVIAGMAAWGISNMTSTGQVWTDKETGAMLKLNLTYTYDITSADTTTTIGPGTGHITIEISQVNQVIVTSPK